MPKKRTKREKKHRLQKAVPVTTTAKNPLAKGLDKLNESDIDPISSEKNTMDLGDGLDLRAGQHKQELGRNPRNDSLPVNKNTSKYKKSQAQKFSRHILDVQEIQNTNALPIANPPTDIKQSSMDIIAACSDVITTTTTVATTDSAIHIESSNISIESPNATVSEVIPSATQTTEALTDTTLSTPESFNTTDSTIIHEDIKQPNPNNLQGSALSFDKPVSFGSEKRLGSRNTVRPRKSKSVDIAPMNNKYKSTKDSALGLTPSKDEQPTHSRKRRMFIQDGDTDTGANTALSQTRDIATDIISADEQPTIVNPTNKPSSKAYDSRLPNGTLSHTHSPILKQEGVRLNPKRIPPTRTNVHVTSTSHKSTHLKNAKQALMSEFQNSQNASFEIPHKISDIDGDIKQDTFDKSTTLPTNNRVANKEFIPTSTTKRKSTLTNDNAPSRVSSTASKDKRSAYVQNTLVGVDKLTPSKPERLSNISDSPKLDKLEKPTSLTTSSDSEKPTSHMHTKKLGKKLETTQRKVEHSTKKLESAKNNLPQKRVLRTDKAFNTENGKQKPHCSSLRFGEEVKTQTEHLRGSTPSVTRPIKTGANIATGLAHKKVFQHEDENVAVKATHKGEMVVESGLRTAYRSHKLAPYRKVQKLDKQTQKLSVNASYRKALHENPELRKNPIARFIQKRRINRNYAKVAREAKRTGTTIKKTATVTQKITATVAKAVKGSPKVLIALGIFFLILVMISGLVSSCSSIASSVGQSIVSLSYLAEEDCIDEAAVFYSYLETDLQLQIINIEETHPDFNEYRLDIGLIGHCQLMLMAYLTAVYHNFTFAEVQEILREIFEEQYFLEIIPEVEIRTRIETQTGTGIDSDGNSFTYTYMVVVEYEWHILNVSLTSIPFSEIIIARMNNEQSQHYALLMQSRGLRQIVLSPFDFYWMPFVSSRFGWRVNPIAGGKEFHRGIDIALPTGTPILAATDGTVTFAGNMGGYGLVVFIDNGEGIVTRYAHCDTLLVNAGQSVSAGDIIATVGNTGNSTGAHLHFEIIADGIPRNPIFFAFTNTF